MGYDVKMYVGRINEYDERTPKWFDVYLMFNLCSVGNPLEDLSYKRDEGTPIYFYGEDGNHKIAKDLYDRPLVALPLEQMLDALKRTMKGSPYRRYKVALDILRSFQTHWGENEEVSVVLFGH